jgi:hypothetical protein
MDFDSDDGDNDNYNDYKDNALGEDNDEERLEGANAPLEDENLR